MWRRVDRMVNHSSEASVAQGMYREPNEQGPRARSVFNAAESEAATCAREWATPLVRLVRNHPLFEHRASQLSIERGARLPQPAAVCFGLGLCGPGAVSEGVPLDVLSMILGADLVRRAIGARTSVAIIADAHAVDSGLPHAEVHALSDRMTDVVRRTVRSCGLALSLVRASELHACADHRSVHAEICRRAGVSTPTYVTLETADTEVMRQRHGAILKLGWSLGGVQDAARDERLFDARYARWVGDRVAFAYVKAGRTLSAERPRSAPYVVADGQTRPLLEPGDDTRGKLERAAQRLPRDRYRAAVRYYGQVVSAFASYGQPLRGSLADRVEGLLETLFSPARDECEREAAE